MIFSYIVIKTHSLILQSNLIRCDNLYTKENHVTIAHAKQRGGKRTIIPLVLRAL